MADINNIILEKSILQAQNIYLKSFLLDNLPPVVKIGDELISTEVYINNVMAMMADHETKIFNTL